MHEKQAKKLNQATERKYECFGCKFSTSDMKILIEHSRNHGIKLNSIVKLFKLSTKQ